MDNYGDEDNLFKGADKNYNSDAGTYCIKTTIMMMIMMTVDVMVIIMMKAMMNK